jgi:CubicO group peptidase (beta-lactamase class C family)
MRNKLILTLFIFILANSCDYCPEQRGRPFEWKFSSPTDQGINADQLTIALDEAKNRPSIYSVLVARNGHIVAERYYRGHDENSTFNIRSVSKSYLSAMVGIAIEEGFIGSINDKMLSYFPEYNHNGLDPRKHDITIEHLLTMQEGMEHEHQNYFQLYNTQNWVESAIEEELEYDPGTKHSYNTFITHLLSAIITRESQMSTLVFCQEYLCDPMGTTIPNWEHSPQGIYFGGNSMFFTTRDMAALGYLYMNDGAINGVQIVPSEWVRKSLQNSAPNSQTIGPWGPMTDIGYGYLWWLGKLRGYKVFMAIGHGGQFVVCVPNLDLIVVTNSNAYIGWTEAGENELSALDLIANWILPAIV